MNKSEYIIGMRDYSLDLTKVVFNLNSAFKGNQELPDNQKLIQYNKFLQNRLDFWNNPTSYFDVCFKNCVQAVHQQLKEYFHENNLL